jgi:Rrf2 family protein
MRISVKGRYALAALTYMAQRYDNGEYISIVTISNALGLSKIYLEQIFTLLKKTGLVKSIKGAQGGYILADAPQNITALKVLSAAEAYIFEATDQTVSEKAPDIEQALKTVVFDKMDGAVKETLQAVTLCDLVAEAEKNKKSQFNMFYI